MNRRHHVGGLLAALASAVALLVSTAPMASAEPWSATEEPTTREFRGAPYLVGRGIGDVTGEIAGVGMSGYADPGQVSSGLHMRQRARAFVVVDRLTGDRVAHVTAEVRTIFASVRNAVLLRLERKYADAYDDHNVMLTATGTHAGPGGHSHHDLDNLTTRGHHERTMRAVVDGIVDAVDRAEADLAPSSLAVSHTRLGNVNLNRSPAAFRRNPAADRAHFPGGRDTRSTTLQVRRHGDLVGAINWSPVRATSLTNDNTLVSGDNSGYAAYHWEHDRRGVDHLAPGSPAFVASFAQTATGDMSPHLAPRPGRGPTDEFENTRLIGTRILEAARHSSATTALTGGVDSRTVHVDMSRVRVDGEFTPDRAPHRTCRAALGTAFAPGSTEDGSGGLPTFPERGDTNPTVGRVRAALHTGSPALKVCQAPKQVLLPVGALDLVQQKLPVQVVRIGALHVVGIPAEVTVTAGLRLRREVARATGADLENVLVQGLTNAYGHHVTTPEEYDAGEYEGAATLFGRYELPAFQQVVHGLATHVAAGTYGPTGAVDHDRSAFQFHSLQGRAVVDSAPLGRRFGDVLAPPATVYALGDRVEVAFVGAHPNNDLHHDGTYFVVERRAGEGWTRVATDGDFETRFTWKRAGASASRVTITWDVPADAEPGTYRLRYFGDAKQLLGPLRPFTGTSPTFTVG